MTSKNTAAANLISVVSEGRTMLVDETGRGLGCILGGARYRKVYAHGHDGCLDLEGVPLRKHAALAREFVAAHAVIG